MRRHLATSQPSGTTSSTAPASVHVVGAGAPADRQLDRLGFLDGLRGVAALAVFVAHALAAAWPPYEDVMASRFDLGRWGVTVFFLCSGFIIPMSLDRQGSLRRFWVRRFFRLYPLYWLNMALCMTCALLGVSLFAHSIAVRPLGVFLANLTMFQAFLGVPYLNTVCWTLTAEMLFYISFSVLFAIRIETYTVPVAVGLLLAASALEALAPLTPGLIYLLPLALIFVGTVFYQVWSGQAHCFAGAAVLALALVAITIPLFGEPGGETGLESQLHSFTARIGAFLFFGVVFLLRARRVSPIARYLGKISYSLYLMHPLVIAVVPRSGTPILDVLIWSVALLLVATATYRWVERPSIELGQYLTRPST